MERTSFLAFLAFLTLSAFTNFAFINDAFSLPPEVAWELDPLLGSRTTKSTAATLELRNLNKRFLMSQIAKDPFWSELQVLFPNANTKAIDTLNAIKEKYDTSKLFDETAINSLLENHASETEEEVCTLIKKIHHDKKATPTLLATHYGYCGKAGTAALVIKTNTTKTNTKTSIVKNNTITNAHRLQRAQKFYRNVRFKDAGAILDQMKVSFKQKTQWCETQFLRGRTFYRLKPRRAESLVAYQSLAQKCVAPEFKNLRKRSLYSWGKRNFDLKKFDASQRVFKTLLNDFSHSSHADDALLFLARIARINSKLADEKKWVTHATKKYPEGDMLHEIVWEHVEALYRKGQYKNFLARLSSLSLPSQDNNYLSQGRLLYFKAQALLQLKKKTTSIKVFQKTWKHYPFSFYGYLSYLRLQKLGKTPTLPERNDKLPIFMTDVKWTHSLKAFALQFKKTQLLNSLLLQMQPEGEDEFWRQAYLYDKVSNFTISHNIIRRKIEGRPWIYPKQGRDFRLHIAWPTPYIVTINNSLSAERAQHPKDFLHAAFPSAIMREESSFIVNVESWAGALGLMQLMPRTAQGFDDDIKGGASIEKLKTAEVNIRVGVDHLMWLSRRTKGHPAMMAAAYNAGLGAVNRWVKKQPNDDIALWVEDIPYFEARNYTKRVMGSYAAYQWILGEKTLDPNLGMPVK